MSKTQELKGYPIPAIIEPEGERCVAFKIPDDDDYHRALVAQAFELSKWWKWKRTAPDTMEAKLSAERFRKTLQWTPIDDPLDCSILDGGVILGTIEDICEGVKCAIEPMIEGALAGIQGGINFTVDEEGNIVVDDGSGAGGIPSDQPAQRERMGAMEYIENRLEEYVVDFEDFYNQTVPADQAFMQVLFTSKYALNANIATAISDYVTWRDAFNPAPNPSFDNVDREFYCKGANKQVASAWYIDNGQADLALMLSLIGALTDEQFDIWEDEVSSNISDDYINTECYRNPPLKVIITPDGWSQLNNPTRIYKSEPTTLLPNRKYLVSITGEFTDGTDTWDGMYESDGVDETYQPLGFDDDNNFTGAVFPDVQPLYEANGYSVIYNMTTTTSFLHAVRSNFTGWTGSITLIFEDYGTL